MTKPRIAIAIDGPAASGKSSTAKAIARTLGFRHVDSGALYRAATAARARQGGDSSGWTEKSVLHAAASVSLTPTETGFTPLIGGEHAEAEMRNEAVTRSVSLVARMGGVRDWVNAQVRNAGSEHDVVVDGRDIGTVVFPDAAVKIFLIADPAERAKRRLRERLYRQPNDGEVAAETRRILDRDDMDAAQSAMAADATVIDTTSLRQAEQIERIASLAREIIDRRSHSPSEPD